MELINTWRSVVIAFISLLSMKCLLVLQLEMDFIRYSRFNIVRFIILYVTYFYILMQKAIMNYPSIELIFYTAKW